MVYKGSLVNGKVFDQNDINNPLTFTLGAGEVIKGWDLGVATMSVGEKAELVIQPEYGYGAQGAGADIGPNAVLIFEVQLVAIMEKDKSSYTQEER